MLSFRIGSNPFFYQLNRFGLNTENDPIQRITCSVPLCSNSPDPSYRHVTPQPYPTVTERRRFAWSNKISIPNSSAVFHVRVLRLQFIHLFLSLKWWENVRVQNAEFRVPQHWAQVYLSRGEFFFFLIQFSVQLHAVMMTVEQLSLTNNLGDNKVKSLACYVDLLSF